MGVKHQKGKQRKDKFYQLAKDTGYRARSAFKLIQLNRRFEFLQSARVLVDLCAAPGSWMQVARQNMPMSSVCVGVDLAPIKPIPHCVTLCEDITTVKCRQAIKRELKTWKADVVLHDGAPNVGKNWLHDAFKQAELTLSACSLAVDILKKGGWFVTKVFRSKDYHALIWVFKSLFAKVHATKPQASRNESAEIFVVCQGFKAPDRIDPKMLSAKFVFGDIDVVETVSGVVGKQSKKTKAVGYAEGDATVYREVNASDLLKSKDYLELLQKCSKIIIDSDEISNHPLTTDEIRSCCADVKVLGRAELKNILKWRKKLNEVFDSNSTEKSVEQNEDEEDELAKVEKEIAELKAQTKAEAKKKKKKLLQERRRILEKLRLTGDPKDNPAAATETSLFSLRNVRSCNQFAESSVDDIPLDEPSEESVAETAARKIFKRDDNIRDVEGGFDSDIEEPDDDSEMEFVEVDDDLYDSHRGSGLVDDAEDPAADMEMPNENDHDLIVEEVELADGKKVSSLEKRSYKADAWFGRDIFDRIEDETEDLELDDAGILGNETKTKSRSSIASGADVEGTGEQDENSSIDSADRTASVQGKRKVADTVTESKESSTVTEKSVAKKRILKLDAEGLTLGSMLLHSKKSRRDIIDSAYNRYMTHDVNLPKWFTDDERKHMRKPVQLDRELLAVHQKRLRDVDVRPIKKVAEAKARKKRKLQKRLERARKRAEVVMDKEDTSTVEKARELRKIYDRARGNKKKEEVKYVVAKKSTSRGRRAARPAGCKGRFKVVDPRMKKDMRAQKRVEKRSKKRGKRR